MRSATMAIQTDAHGFLIGERRLKEISSGIVKTEDNTKQILQILKQSLNEIAPSVESGVRNAFERANRSRNTISAGNEIQPARSARIAKSAVDAAKSASDAAVAAEKSAEAVKHAVKSLPLSHKKSFDAGKGSPKGEAPQPREMPRRGENGRFIGKNGESDSFSDTRSKSFLRKLKHVLTGNGIDGDVTGVDPTVDALKELKDTVWPVGRAFYGMGAKALGVFRGRSKKNPKDIPLPQAQIDANEDQARSSKERNKLLVRLIDAVRGSGGSGNGGLTDMLGGLIGGGGKGGGKGKGKGLGKMLGRIFKGAGKKLPFIGTAVGGGLLANEWNSLDDKGKGQGIGELAGAGVGGVLGAYGGPVGAVAGSMLGSYLGGIFGAKIGSWVNDLRKVDFGNIFKKSIENLSSSKLGSGSKAFIPFSLPMMAARAGMGIGSSIRNYVSEKFGGGGSSGVTPYSNENFDYSSAPGNKNNAGNVANSAEARRLGMFNALRKAGFQDDRALALVGQIGRENDFSDKMFSTHIDPAKDEKGRNIKNGGALSWNRGRYDKFSAFMKERGLMDANGNMPKTQAVLDAQAEFIKSEMSNPEYAKKMGMFNDGKKRDPREYAQELSRYIGWARGQDTIRGKNGERVSFDWRAQDSRANRHTDEAAKAAKLQSDQINASSPKSNARKAMPSAKGQSTSPVIFKPNAARPPEIKIPAITPELSKIGKDSKKTNVTAQSTSSVGQTVADRGLAHIMAGGLGYNASNA